MGKNIFDEYFNFSSSERRSILIISILILISISASFIIRYKPVNKQPFSEGQMREIHALADRFKEKEQSEKIEKTLVTATNTYFIFNPNTASKEELKKLGFSEKQINTIKNYIKSGGKFYKKEDFKKIYNISEEQYIIYEPYIVIEEKQNIKETPKNKISLKSTPADIKSTETVIAKVELNSAETYKLMMINGIGEVYANRIIKYRELLGGFSDKKQLLEVYGINDTIFNQISPQIELDISIIKTINLNEATYKDLIKHPYLDSYNTEAILNYRKFKKQNILRDDLLKDNVLSKEVYNNIKPYIRP